MKTVYVDMCVCQSCLVGKILIWLTIDGMNFGQRDVWFPCIRQSFTIQCHVCLGGSGFRFAAP